MKICSYTMNTDKGFAPNPFNGFCTLAACTPNHMNARLEPGDLIAGYFNDRDRPYLVYYMVIDEVLGFNDYYHNPRFAQKKPQLNGDWKKRCGDNIYHRDKSGKWIQDKSPYHQNDRVRKQDIRYAIVYLGTTFGCKRSRNHIFPGPDSHEMMLPNLNHRPGRHHEHVKAGRACRKAAVLEAAPQ